MDLQKIKKYIWKYLPIAKTVAFVVVLILAGLSLLTLLPLKTHLKPYIVLSGSMRPTIPEGSIAFVVLDSSNLNVGDVITFIKPDNARENVTHRIVQIEPKGKSFVYNTKGDANNGADLWSVHKEAVWGKVAFSIPLIGFIVNFARTREGVILVIVLPLLIIALSEGRVIYKEIGRMKKPKPEQNLEYQQLTQTSTTKKKKSKSKKTTKTSVAAVLVILSLFTYYLPIGTTWGSFSDSVTVTNNQIQTTYWGAPGDVIINEVMWMGSSSSTADEWIELRNTTSHAINLTNWKIDGAGTGSASITLSGTIPANGFFLLSNNASNASRISDTITVDQVTASLSLANGGEQLTLENALATTIDQTPAVGWPAGVDGPANWQSMERNNTPGDGTQNASWHTCIDAGCNDATYWDTEANDYGTPKAANLSTNDPTASDYIKPTLAPTNSSSSATPSIAPEASSSPSASPSPTPIPEPISTPSPTPEPSVSPSPTPEPSITPLPSPQPSSSPEPQNTDNSNNATSLPESSSDPEPQP